MDIIISFLLVVIAVCMVFQKPLQIVVTHKHEVMQPVMESPDPEQAKIDEEVRNTMDDVISTIQEIMGVERDDDINKPA
jgi:hypothetical protein